VKSVVVHYQEIALKGRNRPWFIGRLVRNLKNATRDLDVRHVVPRMGRIEIVLGADDAWEEVAERVRHTFGVANFSRAGRAPLDMDALADAILADLGDLQPSTFRVSAKRADKRLPLTSPQIEREVGGRIKEVRGWTVNLGKPELTIHVDALSGEAFYYFGKHPGPGGMPTGVSGRVACLLSGGIDSPVAAYRLMRRGCRVMAVHFHSYPILSRASQDKVRELAAVLTRYQQYTKVYMVPFGEIQQQILLAVAAPLRVVIYRRLMMRIAEALAHLCDAKALVTGEVIGQVASQTLENMTAIGSVVQLPVFRPLIGMDKEEITVEAKRLGTYPISILEDQDCCQLFTPKHPATKARARDIESAERTLPIDEFVRSAVGLAVAEEFKFPLG
jgi:thiamine biosynthesis protein ThiI